ncbi:MAG TPA: hypothetical protein VGA59_04375 [Ramlibacter sp.]|jgi:hypothetical protein
MLKTAVVLFALTAMGGLIMAFIRFSGSERPPSWLAMGHGLLAGSGLTLVLYDAFTAGLPTLAWLGAGVLVVAAAGGAFLNLAYHAQLKALPKGIVVLHALLAVAGFGLLALAAFR